MDHLRRRLAAVLILSAAALGTPAAAQQPLVRPFELLPGEQTSVQFALIATGQVTVQVQARGEALVVRLTGPDGQTQERTGTGNIGIKVDTTTARVGVGTRLWTVGIRPARAYTVPAAGYTSAPSAIATGTVTIAGPLMTEDAVRALIQPELTKRKAETDARQQASSRRAASDPTTSLRAAMVQQTVARQAQQLQALGARLSPSAQTMIQPRGSTPVTKSVDPGVRARMPVGVLQPGPAAPPPPSGGASKVGTATAAATGVGTVAATSFSVASLSVSQGEPGTPVLIAGTGFTEQRGEVHFIVANGRDLVAPITAWNDAQVLTQVPTVEGVLAFNGFVYVKRADGKSSPLIPFAFQPMMDVVRFCLSSTDAADVRIGAPGGLIPVSSFATISHPERGTPWVGFAGYDEVYLSTRLKNGWQTAEVQVMGEFCRGGAVNGYGMGTFGAYIVESRIGTDSPYVKIRFWMDAFTVTYYSVAVTARGPKGLPYR